MLNVIYGDKFIESYRTFHIQKIFLVREALWKKILGLVVRLNVGMNFDRPIESGVPLHSLCPQFGMIWNTNFDSRGEMFKERKKNT